MPLAEEIVETWAIHDPISRYLLVALLDQKTSYGLWEWGVR